MINGCVACGEILPAGAKICPACQWPVAGADEPEEKLNTVEETAEAEEKASVDKAEKGQPGGANPMAYNGNQPPFPNANPTMNGFNGQQNFQGLQGMPGQQGMMGQQMMPGQPGMMGQQRMPGQPGMMGQQMMPGQPGMMGQQMMPGQPGINGNGYMAQQAYPQNVNAYGQPIGAQQYGQGGYQQRVQPNRRPEPIVVPPGSTLFRGKVYTEEEIEKMMKSYTPSAIVALIFGLLGFVMVIGNLFFVISSLPGFVFSIVGAANAGTYNSNPKKKRDGRATTGKVFGILGIIFGVFSMLFSLVALVLFFAADTDISAFRWIGSDFCMLEFLRNLR